MQTMDKCASDAAALDETAQKNMHHVTLEVMAA